MRNAPATEGRAKPQRSDGPLKVLLSEGSSTSARQTLYGLGRDYIIDIVDPSPWCQCRFSSLVRRWHRCPAMARDPAGYLRFVGDLVRREHYDVLIPTHEQVYLLSKFRDALGQFVGLALPDFAALRRVHSKAEFAKLLDELEIPTPETLVLHTERELLDTASYPVYLKLNYSTASHGVSFVRNEGDLRQSLDRFQQRSIWSEGEAILLQRPAAGVQCVVNALFQRGRLIATHCMELLATGIGGGPSLRVSVLHPAVVEHLRKLGAYLNWHGPLLLDYFWDPATQRPAYIECNPRIGESVNGRLSGVDFCDLVVKMSLGQNLAPVPVGKDGVRSHTGFIVLIAEAFNGASRRRLLGHLWRVLRRRGEYGSGENEMTRPREDLGSLVPAAATTVHLLISPRYARRLSTKTVENYALPQAAAEKIDQLPLNALAEFDSQTDTSQS